MEIVRQAIFESKPVKLISVTCENDLRQQNNTATIHKVFIEKIFFISIISVVFKLLIKI